MGKGVLSGTVTVGHDGTCLVNDDNDGRRGVTKGRAGNTRVEFGG